LLLRDIDPWMLAGLLYLGSGLGLIAVRTFVRVLGSGTRGEAAIRGGHAHFPDIHHRHEH
jgi:hypothetical protein